MEELGLRRSDFGYLKEHLELWLLKEAWIFKHMGQRDHRKRLSCEIALHPSGYSFLMLLQKKVITTLLSETCLFIISNLLETTSNFYVEKDIHYSLLI